MLFLNIRGVNINYEVVGETGPWLALTTGGRCGYAEFISFAHRIAAKGFRVLLHDRRNTGASDVVIAGEEGTTAYLAPGGRGAAYPFGQTDRPGGSGAAPHSDPAGGPDTG